MGDQFSPAPPWIRHWFWRPVVQSTRTERNDDIKKFTYFWNMLHSYLLASNGAFQKLKILK